MARCEHAIGLSDPVRTTQTPGADPSAPSDPLLLSRANLDWAMDRWLKARAKKGDVVLFAFAGRGD